MTSPLCSSVNKGGSDKWALAPLPSSFSQGHPLFQGKLSPLGINEDVRLTRVWVCEGVVCICVCVCLCVSVCVCVFVCERERQRERERDREREIKKLVVIFTMINLSCVVP